MTNLTERPLVDTRRDGELARVAHMHFVEGLDQKEIAQRIHASRSTVSRMVRQAVERGIVQISVHFPASRNTALEQQLATRLGLDQAVIVDGDAVADPPLRGTLGSLGAEVINRELPARGSLAVCWGRSIGHVIDHLDTFPAERPNVVQMIGSLRVSDDASNGVELARHAANRLSATLELLSAPLMVDSVEAAHSLRSQTDISRVLEHAARADVALVGLGALDAQSSALVAAGYVSASDTEDLRALGAVGDVAGVFIDRDGRDVSADFSGRIIGVTLEDLRAIRHTVAMAYGLSKVEVIGAAARGGYITTLLTDSSTAQALLAHHTPS